MNLRIHFYNLALICISGTMYAESVIQTEVIINEPAPIAIIPNNSASAYHATSIIPACLDMLQNLASIMMDPTNPSVVGPNTIYILQNVATIIHELMHNQQNQNQPLQEITIEMDKKIIALKNDIERYVTMCHECTDTTRTLLRTHNIEPGLSDEKREEAEKIIANVVAIIRSIGDIAQHPHDKAQLTESIAQMVDCLLHIGLEIKELRDMTPKKGLN